MLYDKISAEQIDGYGDYGPIKQRMIISEWNEDEFTGKGENGAVVHVWFRIPQSFLDEHPEAYNNREDGGFGVRIIQKDGSYYPYCISGYDTFLDDFYEKAINAEIPVGTVIDRGSFNYYKWDEKQLDVGDWVWVYTLDGVFELTDGCEICADAVSSIEAPMKWITRFLSF